MPIALLDPIDRVTKVVLAGRIDITGYSFSPPGAPMARVQNL
jgi:hypothetical protein